MQCPKCSFEQADQQAECGRRGLIFDKYRQRQSNPPPKKKPPGIQAADLKVMSKTR